MKIKTLLTALALVWGLPSIYGQQATVEENVPLSTVHFLLHKAPPRKEIRHRLSTHPQDNDLLQTSARATGDYLYKEFPTTGEIKGVVILAAFADVPFSVSDDSIKTLLSNRYNADNYTEEVKFNEYSKSFGEYVPLDITIPGSARDYFRDQSFGQFTPSFDVIGPITLDSIRAYYGANNASGNDKNAKAMFTEACQKAFSQGLTDFTDYDNDGDGVVDFVYVVYAGCDEAQTHFEEAIWAKATNISLTLKNGMKIGRSVCSSELVIDLDEVAGIGTFVHEFSHVLGLPDFYNTSAVDFTMDVWSIMDYGMYNAEGFVPNAYTSFERYSLGWIPMHTLDQPATMSIGTTEKEGKGYRIFTSTIDSTNITAADTASFYVIETIRQEGWNLYAANNHGEGIPPIQGLLISEVTYNAAAWRNNRVNVEANHRYCIVPANNIYHYKNPGMHLFGAEVVDPKTQQVFINTAFTIDSTPASITQFGAAMDKPLTDIRYDAETGKTTFNFCGGKPETPDTPQNPDDTEIENLELSIQHSGIIYDLQGRPVENPSKGIYILNGKKVIIK